jgi:hypothetical protein
LSQQPNSLEALGFLELTRATGEKLSWTGGFALVAYPALVLRPCTRPLEDR